ncbi:hypothetical protein Z043_103597 [Scleropages formosus]|uniref:C3H1-type domain-containing protein n=1 Tax=Scleropages formosus TaxID=113540 RepID=A0A0P7XJM2_SCLFO|nr:hypothetical protein Z043_103597 [Scleropages formosus]
MEERGQKIPKKSKKKKGKKQDNRVEDRQQCRRGRVNGPPSFVKKQPYLSQEFISQHAIQRDGRLFCKFFLSGRCIKEEACKFEHEFVVPDKKQELCKFYVLGFCTKGADCIYMHNDYPCKFFHTGTKCYQGDHCKFSHDPLTEVTRPLLEKVLNKNEEDEGKQENSVPSATAPPPPSTDSKPLQLGLRPNFYNSSSLLSGPPLPSVSLVTADNPAESLFSPLPPLEPLNSPNSDAEDQKIEAKVGHLQPIAVRGGSTYEEQDTEARLKDTPVVIPLDLLPGVVLKDPRHPYQMLGELTLSWPAFAHAVDSLHKYKSLSCTPLLNNSTQEAPAASSDNQTGDTSGTMEVRSLTTGPVDPPGVPPGQEGDVQYENTAAPAVHNLPVLPLATWGRQAHTAPSHVGTQVKTTSVFQDMFKTPLPLLSSSDNAV